jgi:nicotinamidase-related amidase
MLDRNRTFLIVTDIQGNLAESMHEKEKLFKNAGVLIDGMRIIGIPILWVEQYPQGLGPTIPEIACRLSGCKPFPKKTFSSLKDPAILEQIRNMRRDQAVLTGIETHVCIFQTSADLIDRGIETHVPADAVSSRTEFNKNIGLGRIAKAGGHITSVESILFELLGASGGEDFKRILGIVK